MMATQQTYRLFPLRRRLLKVAYNDWYRYHSTTPPADQPKLKSYHHIDETWKIIQNLSWDERQDLSRRWLEEDPNTAPAPLVDQNEVDKTTIEKVFEKMDQNDDGTISQEEFHAYFSQRKMPRKRQYKNTDENTVVPPVSFQNYRQLALCTALPFLGFGFLDNFLMLTAGEFLDMHFCQTMGFSTMAAAALGNTFSDVAGIGMSGVVQSFAGRMGVPTPELEPAQWQLPKTRAIVLGSSAGGITVGCILGMAPLLWL